MMDTATARPPRVKASLVPLISKFEFLNAKSAEDSLASSLAVPGLARHPWRHSCPAVNNQIPRFTAVRTDPGLLGRLGHGHAQGHAPPPPPPPPPPPSPPPPVRRSVPCGNRYHDRPHYLRSPPSYPAAASTKLHPARFPGPGQRPDTLTVSERRKLFEGPKDDDKNDGDGDGRPRTSGGETSFANKLVLVSSFKTGPAGHLAPPVPIHSSLPRQQRPLPDPEARFHVPFQAPRPSFPDGPHGGDGERDPRQFKREYSTSPPYNGRVAQATSASHVPRTFEVPTNFWSTYGNKGNTPDSSPTKVPNYLSDVGPQSHRRARPGAGGRDWDSAGPRDVRDARVRYRDPFAAGSRDPSPAARRHGSIPDPGGPSRERGEYAAAATRSGGCSVTSSGSPSSNPHTPEPQNFLEVPLHETTPGRTSMPPSSPVSHYSLPATAASRTRPRVSAQNSSSGKSTPPNPDNGGRGNVLSLKKLFDTPPRAHGDAGALDHEKRRRALPEPPKSAALVPYPQPEPVFSRRPFVASSYSLVPVSSKHPYSEPPTPEGSPTRAPHAGNSPLKAKIGFFDSLGKTNLATGQAGPATGPQSYHAAHRTADAVRKLKNIHKSKSFKSWKRFQGRWLHKKEANPSGETASEHGARVETRPPPATDPAYPRSSESSGVVGTPVQARTEGSVVVPPKAVLICGYEDGDGSLPGGGGSNSNSNSNSRADGPRPAGTSRPESYRWPASETAASLVGERDLRMSGTIVMTASAAKAAGSTDASSPTARQAPSTFMKRKPTRYVAPRVTWGRRQVSKRAGPAPVVANAQCSLRHPRPVRGYEVNRLVSLCRNRGTFRSSSYVDQGHDGT